MSDIRKLIADLLGKIFLTKKTMFGLDEQQIVLIISPSLKIFDITSRPQKLVSKFPFQKNRILVTDELKKWAMDNGYPDATVKDILPAVKKEIKDEFNEFVSQLPEELMETYIGKNNIEKLRKKRLAAAKAAPQNVEARPVATPKAEEKEIEKLNQRDFFRKLQRGEIK